MIHRLKDPKLKPYACALILFTLNLLIAWRLFWVEFTTHMNSNEGTFMAVSRFLVENGFHFDWFPYWMNGIPFENTYSPLVQIMNALVSVATHWSAARAFHFTLAFFYCLGPCLLFLFAWRITGLLRISFLAALLYSLFSPSTMYGPVRGDVGGWSYPRRLHTMVAYGEAAHNIVLALLPLALLLIWLAVTRKQWHWNLLAGCSMAVLVLMNAFAAVDLGLATACLVAFYGGFKRMLLIGPAAYLSICPFLTPSLIQTIRKDSALSGFHVTSAALRVDALIVSGAILIWFWLRRRSPFDGLVLSLAWIFTVIASFAHWFGIAVLPQSERYHLEMELTICLAFVFAIRSLLRPMGTGILIGVLATQFLVYRTYARELIKKNDITNSVEYRLARWIGTNLPGKRIMAGGEFGFWFNVFADNAQFKGGH
ncbi:MAG: hypothetical protein JO022_16835, partial [Acidobacteriaceae bacterium]|nr:hypothetical protein [Acidobacteriaceae bacterium]